jgi:hypothetical protein
VKAIRHAVGEMHQRDGTGLDIGRIEHGEVGTRRGRCDSLARDRPPRAATDTRVVSWHDDGG